MSNPTERRDMQEENYSGAYGVGPDETQSKSASVRGFESPLPHSSLLSSNSVMTAELGVRRARTHSDSNPVHPALLEEHPCF